MKEEKAKEIQADLAALCAKHEITHASLCGTVQGGTFIGMTADERLTPLGFFLCACNAGHLWQCSRELAIKSVNRFGGGGAWLI